MESERAKGLLSMYDLEDAKSVNVQLYDEVLPLNIHSKEFLVQRWIVVSAAKCSFSKVIKCSRDYDHGVPVEKHSSERD